jgi:hypothetical protein
MREAVEEGGEVAEVGGGLGAQLGEELLLGGGEGPAAFEVGEGFLRGGEVQAEAVELAGEVGLAAARGIEAVERGLPGLLVGEVGGLAGGAFLFALCLFGERGGHGGRLRVALGLELGLVLGSERGLAGGLGGTQLADGVRAPAEEGEQGGERDEEIGFHAAEEFLTTDCTDGRGWRAES